MLNDKINITPTRRGGSDISRFKRALIAAESANENYKQLFDMCKDALLDDTVRNGYQSRILNIINSKIVFINADGTQNTEIQKHLNRSLFASVLEEIIKTKLWGHSLIEFYLENKELKMAALPREHVKPRAGIVVEKTQDTNGVAYKDKKLNVIWAEEREVGALVVATLFAIVKTVLQTFWLVHAEKYGMPLRKGFYVTDEERELLLEAFQMLGANADIILPKGVDVEAEIMSGASNVDIYEKLMIRADKAIATVLLGQTMTTQAASSYAQAQVHQNTWNEVKIADKEYVLRVLNERYIYILNSLLKLNLNGTFQYANIETLSIKDRLNIDVAIAQQVPISASYWYEKYNVPQPIAGESSKKEAGKLTSNDVMQLTDNAIKLVDYDAFGRATEAKDAVAITRLFAEYIIEAITDVANASSYTDNVFEFAALKAVNALNMLIEREPASVYATHNAWLQTESKNAGSAAQLGEKYNRLVELDETHYFEIMSVNDEHTRESHRDMDGLVIEMRGENAQKYLPPFDHNCRCTYKAIPKSNKQLTDREKFKEIAERVVKPEFRFNAGIDDVVFPRFNAYTREIESRAKAKSGDFEKNFNELMKPIQEIASKARND